ncbi:hypothetical protein GC089_04250 [Cellulomonas sp. JZ18]|uniref:hypothetical protein n=1 Tax=Cellulomonas sp. JZ18 TaxID=2654191 RepID=UPI0012D46905|nr:hypothetical protein [Cellulomonas sp. JZ18]QGQ18599.1 hypothetical protein GC089_04250 [Cellulomonas sp. JZ18]
MTTTVPHRTPSAPRALPPARREPLGVHEDRSLRSAVAVVAAGLVLVALLVGGGALVATAVDLASWLSAG